MNTPHKHAALIHAWADGADIEYKDSLGCWRRCASPAPSWHEDCEYRIKPQIDKRRYRVALFRGSAGQFFTTTSDGEIEAYEDQSLEGFHVWLTDWVEYEIEVQP